MHALTKTPKGTLEDVMRRKAEGVAGRMKTRKVVRRRLLNKVEQYSEAAQDITKMVVRMMRVVRRRRLNGARVVRRVVKRRVRRVVRRRRLNGATVVGEW